MSTFKRDYAVGTQLNNVMYLPKFSAIPDLIYNLK